MPQIPGDCKYLADLDCSVGGTTRSALVFLTCCISQRQQLPVLFDLQISLLGVLALNV